MRLFHIISFIFLIALAACGKAKPSGLTKPLVLVSIAPYQHFAEKIGGEEIAVQSIVPQTANAHVFEPTPRQREALKEARIWFRIGEPFELSLIPLFPKEGQIVDLRDGIELLEFDDGHTCHDCSHDNKDRHIWMSPKLAKLQALMIAETLKEAFPEKETLFEKNLEQLLSQLDALDTEIQLALRSLQNRSLLVSHPAFGYYCHEYGLRQLSVEQEGKDPRPKHLERLLDIVKNNPPTLSLAMPQHNNKGVQLIAKELKTRLRVIDPYSNDYFSMMRALTEMIAPNPEMPSP